MASTKAGIYNVRLMPPIIRGGADMLIGGRLRACRTDQGRRIDELAAIAGVPPARLMAIEAGLVRPGAAELVRIAMALGAVLANLFAPADDC